MEKKTLKFNKIVGKLLFFWLPVVLWASIIFSFSSKPAITTSEVHWQDFTVKKIAHVAFYGVLATLIYRALRNEKIGKKNAGYISAITSSLYGITDEIHQSFTPGREPTVRDVIFDTIGTVFAIYLIWNILPKTPKRLRNWAKKLHIL